MMSNDGKSNEIDNIQVIDMTGYERIKILFQRINYGETSYAIICFLPVPPPPRSHFVLNFQFFHSSHSFLDFGTCNLKPVCVTVTVTVANAYI